MHKIKLDWTTQREFKKTNHPITLSIFFKKPTVMKYLLLKHISKKENILKYRNKLIDAFKGKDILEKEILSKLIIKFSHYFKDDDYIYFLLRKYKKIKALFAISCYSSKFYNLNNFLKKDFDELTLFYAVRADKRYLHEFIKYCTDNNKCYLIVKALAYYPFLICTFDKLEGIFNGKNYNYIENRMNFLTRKEASLIYKNNKLFDNRLNKYKMIIINKHNYKFMSFMLKYKYLIKLIKNKRNKMAVEVINDFICASGISQSYKGMFIYFKMLLNNEPNADIFLSACGKLENAIYFNLIRFFSP